MAKKVYYSKPLKYFWQHFYGTQKKLTPHFTEEQIFAVLRQNILAAPMRPLETSDSRQIILSGLEMWREDSRGELLHIFFLDKQLRDFLESTNLSDLEGVKKYLFEQGKSRDIIHVSSKSESNLVVYQFALHIPYESDGYAFSLSLEEDGSVQLYFSLGDKGGLMSDEFYGEVIKKGDEVSIMQSRMFRLAINTIAYMKCFPDCVADGVPKNLLERGESKTPRNFTLALSEEIKKGDNPQVSRIPHFRKGHFRLLQSDYFSNKKGQIIFVAETMVKGKAKTVAMSKEKEKLSGKDLSE